MMTGKTEEGRRKVWNMGRIELWNREVRPGIEDWMASE